MRYNMWAQTLAAAVVLAVGSAAQAGFIATSTVQFANDTPINCDNADQTYTSLYHTYSWGLTNDGSGVAALSDHMTVAKSNQGTFTDVVDGDPTKLITEDLYNDTGVNWIGYTLTITSLTPGMTAVFAGPATSTDAFGDAVFLSPSTLTYSGVFSGTPLADSASAELKYKIVLTPPPWLPGQHLLRRHRNPSGCHRPRTGLPGPAGTGRSGPIGPAAQVRHQSQ